MKIVGLKEFLTLPAGTLFFRYEEDRFDTLGLPALMIKGESLDDTDYEATSAASDLTLDTLILLSNFCKSGESFTLKPVSEKFAGDYKPEWLYGVFEGHDHYQLIERLIKAYADTRGQHVKETKITFEPKKQFVPPRFQDLNDQSLEQLIEELSIDDSSEPVDENIRGDV